MTEFMYAQLVGGPYDGRFVAVSTNSVDHAGEPIPANLVYSLPDPTVPQVLLDSPGAEKVLGEDPLRRLTYDRQHRGDRWVYVLHGMTDGLPEETDPILAALIQHIRREWPKRLYFSAGERIPRYAREEYGQDFEDHMRRALMHRLHEDAAKQDLMILAVDGPAWNPEHPRTRPPMYGEPDDVFEARAVGLPRYHPPRRSTS